MLLLVSSGLLISTWLLVTWRLGLPVCTASPQLGTMSVEWMLEQQGRRSCLRFDL
jgi:hypothetical protein